MRQKPVNEEAARKMLQFLQAVRNPTVYFGDYRPDLTIAQIIKETGVSKSSAVIAEKLGFLKRHSKVVWDWLTENPNRKMALAILDELLHKNKKQVHVPLLPELATAVDVLAKISSKLDIYLTQNESILKRLKQGNNEPAILSETLFSEEEQERREYFELLVAVTTGHYGNYDFVTPYQNVNDTIINATKDLFTKYINLKSNKNERTKQFKNQEEHQDDKLLATR